MVCWTRKGLTWNFYVQLMINLSSVWLSLYTHSLLENCWSNGQLSFSDSYFLYGYLNSLGITPKTIHPIWNPLLIGCISANKGACLIDICFFLCFLLSCSDSHSAVSFFRAYIWALIYFAPCRQLFLLFMSFSLAVEALHAFIQEESHHK